MAVYCCQQRWKREWIYGGGPKDLFLTLSPTDTRKPPIVLLDVLIKTSSNKEPKVLQNHVLFLLFLSPSAYVANVEKMHLKRKWLWINSGWWEPPSGYGFCLRIFQTLSNEEKTMSQRFIQTLRTLLSPPLHFYCICISSEFVSMAGGGEAGLGLKTLQVFVFQSSPSASRALYRHLSRSFI